MKSLKFLIIAFLSISTISFLNSCKKDSTIDDTVVSDSDKKEGLGYSTSQNLFEEAYNLIDAEAKQQSSLNLTNGNDITLQVRACPTITLNPTGNTFPKTLTIDYGTGCTTRQGVNASGKITAVFSGKASTAGTTVTVTFTNFVYKGYTLGGTYKVQYSSATTFTAQISDGTITDPNGLKYAYTANLTLSQTAGQATTFATNGSNSYLDDVFSITGNGTYKDPSGKSYTVNITTAMVKKLDCQWIVSGVVEAKSGSELTKKLDFGTGTCDNQATLTIGRASSAITLP